MTPQSKQEAKRLGYNRYNTGKPCRNGHESDRLTSTSQCCACKREHQARLRVEDPQTMRSKDQATYQRTKPARLEYQREYYLWLREHHDDYLRFYARNYRACNWNRLYKLSKYQRLSNCAARRALSRQARLPGYSSELCEIYKHCPQGYHVDHIVPLNGENVCGLHVPWNLQYLPWHENLAKSNQLFNEPPIQI